MPDQTPSDPALDIMKFMASLRLGDEIIEQLLRSNDPEVAGYALQSLVHSAPPDVKAAMERFERGVADRGISGVITDALRSKGPTDAVGLLTQLLGQLRPGQMEVVRIPLRSGDNPKEVIADVLDSLGSLGLSSAPPTPQSEEEMRSSARKLLEEIDALDPQS